MHEPPSRPLILIGYRATGKTTVGRLIASQLGWDFFDLDEAIEASFGGTIADIFAAEGEPGFRERESLALAEACTRTRCVLSTGGGIILRPANRLLLRSAGTVVWLTAAPETLWDRIRTDPVTAARRPNLTASGGLPEIRSLLEAREPHYRETADFVVDADHPSPEVAAAAILKTWLGSTTFSSASSASSSSPSA
jgi:shikimate kinase